MLTLTPSQPPQCGHVWQSHGVCGNVNIPVGVSGTRDYRPPRATISRPNAKKGVSRGPERGVFWYLFRYNVSSGKSCVYSTSLPKWPTGRPLARPSGPLHPRSRSSKAHSMPSSARGYTSPLRHRFGSRLVSTGVPRPRSGSRLQSLPVIPSFVKRFGGMTAARVPASRVQSYRT